MADEHIDFGDDEYGGSQKMQYPGGGTIPALADEEPIGEDDEYDELYNDVNVGDSFMQMHRPEAPTQPGGMANSGVAAQKNDGPDPRFDTGSSRDQNIPGAPGHGKYAGPGASFPGQNEGQPAINRPDIGSVGYPQGSSVLQKGGSMEIARDNQVKNMGFQGMAAAPSKMGIIPDMPQKYANEAAQSFNSGAAGPHGAPQVPANQMGISFNQPMVNDNLIRPPVENGPTMLFVGELHWWTTDAELEGACSQFGRIKEIKFFDERASGKSKGYCQVEFYDPSAAAACKEGMNGHLFNGRACVVAFASPQTLKQMGASYTNRAEGQSQSQTQGRRPNDGMGRGGNGNNQGGDAGRNFGRGAWGRGGQGPGPGGPGRGRGAMGVKNMGGVGNGAGGMGGYGRGPGPAYGGPPGGMMHPQGMMGGGFDPTYMGRGGGYGGFPGPGFPGMLPPFPGAMGLGVAPHINPAFFGRGMAPNGMGMMGSSGMDGPHAGMWGDSSMGGWGGDEQDRRTRESSYGGEDGGSEYGYGEANQEKGRSSAASREKERPSEREYSENTDKRHRSERDRDWDRSEREPKEHRYREEKDGYREHRHRERDVDYEDDWDRGQSSSRSRSRSRAMVEEKHRSRSRDADYGKRRRGPSE